MLTSQSLPLSLRNKWTKAHSWNLLRLFGYDLLFLSLQGSYGRGEAKETNDIDSVIILLQCGKDEILKYRAYIDGAVA